MNHNHPASYRGSRRRAPGTFARRRAAFTLLEVLIASSILAVAISMTMVVFLAALKRAQNTENALDGTGELRRAVDNISLSVRSASKLPTLDGGRKLVVAPEDMGIATIRPVTPIDAAAGVSGSKSNQPMLHVTNATLPTVITSVWASETNRPSGVVTSATMATFFKTSEDDYPTKDLNEIFKSGDTIIIPATAYGARVERIVKEISNNKGNKTVTLTTNLGVDVPSGTKIQAPAGREAMYEVVDDSDPAHVGELRYYPDRTKTSKYVVLARDIDWHPLSDPSNSASARATPFAIATTSPNYVTINLQKIPKGTRVGRTIQGFNTAVFTRINPNN